MDRNLEELIIVLGTRKDTVKRFLLKHFKQDRDYTISLTGKLSKGTGGGGKNKELIMINDKTFELISNSYNLKNRYVSNTIIKNPFLTNIESNTVGFIQSILNNIIDCKRQYKVGRYFIDLYIPSKNLAVECDEYNHKHYDQGKQNEREKYIKENLNCNVIRFDPCSEDFIFEEFVNEILKIVTGR